MYFRGEVQNVLLF